MIDRDPMPAVEANLSADGVCRTNDTGYCNRTALAYGGGIAVSRELISQGSESGAAGAEFAASFGPLLMAELAVWREALCGACGDCPVNAVIRDIDTTLATGQ